jgi:hypothetical protein
MFRRLAIVTVALTGVCGIAVGTGVIAGADPADDPALCHYTMSDPHVVDVSGTQMVTAMLTPAACTGNAKPSFSQVCVSSGESAGTCADVPGYATAHAYLSPYVPGRSYTAKGRGCASQAIPPAAFCSSLGPRTVTL